MSRLPAPAVASGTMVGLRLRTGVRRLGALLACFLVLGAFDMARAEGRDIGPAQYPAYRQALLDAKTPGDVNAVMRTLGKTSRATHGNVYGNIVGPILKDASLTAQHEPARRRMLLAELIAHMVDEQPEGDVILLLEDILLQLGSDPALVERLLAEPLKADPVTGRNRGWDRLIARALELVRASKDDVRRAAIRVTSFADDEDTALVVAALHDTLRAGDRTFGPEDEAAYLDAAERLLAIRFPDLGTLVSFLNGFVDDFGTPESRAGWTAAKKERIRATLYRAVIERLRSEGGEQASRERQAALDYGRAVIEKAKAPEDMRVFFDPERVRIPELQQAAMLAAARLDPKPTQPWADLFVAALDHSDHMGVLDGVVALLTRTFTTPSDPGQLLAAAVARRLAARVEQDRVDLREKLAVVLGRIGTAKDVRDALAGRGRVAADRQEAVWSQLIRDLGTVADGQVLWLKPHYLPPAARPDWERLAVAETLGQQGFRKTDAAPRNPESPQATLLLLHILHGWGGKVFTAEEQVKDGEETRTVTVTRLFVDDGETNELESDAAKAAAEGGRVALALERAAPDPSEAVREAAVNSLTFHTGPHAARALARVADEANDVGNAALRVLGLQLGRGNEAAARALAAILDAAPAPDRQRAVLEILARTAPPKAAGPRAALGKAVVAALVRGGPEPLRRAAAKAAAHLAQLDAIKPVYLAWHELAPEDAEGRAVWRGLLRDGVAGVAGVDVGDPAKRRALDLELESVIKGLVGMDTGHEENAGMLAAILAELGQPGERFALKRLRAELATQYVGIQKGRTLDQRRAELDGVIELYRELAEEAPATAKGEMQRMLYDVLHRRWTKWLRTGEGAEDPATLQLDALAAAVASKDPGTADRALESEVAALGGRDDLGDEQKDRFGKLKGELDALLAARESAPKNGG